MCRKIWCVGFFGCILNKAAFVDIFVPVRLPRRHLAPPLTKGDRRSDADSWLSASIRAVTLALHLASSWHRWVDMSEHGRFACTLQRRRGGQRDGNARHVFHGKLNVWRTPYHGIPCPIESFGQASVLGHSRKGKSVQCWPLFLSVISNKSNGMRRDSLLISDQWSVTKDTGMILSSSSLRQLISGQDHGIGQVDRCDGCRAGPPTKAIFSKAQ